MANKRGKLILVLVAVVSFSGISYAANTTGSIDWNKVQSTRTSWHNQERSGAKIKPYTGNKLLNVSAQKWAEHLAQLGTATHQRLSGDGYYNYWSIKSRFGDIGIDFKNASGTMFSESLGRGYYSCKKADCTDSLLQAIKSTWKFFMSEKYKKSRPHYLAIVSKNFTSLGLGVAFAGNKYYLVTHYGKGVVKK